ncbi:MAG: type IX secretion system membrane protein PorP/SprF [Chitinophagales bacterium]
MRKFNTIIAGIIILLVSAESKAQQKPLFTNYVFNQFYYNPAVAATSEAIDFRFLYRNQWAGLDGKPHTQTLSAFGALKDINLGLGGNVYHDQTGHIRNTGFNLSASYAVNIGDESMLSGGISAGIIHYKLANDINIRESDDAAVISAQEGRIAPDIGLGIYFKRKGLYAGFSMPQVIQSSLEFNVEDPDNRNKLMRHYFLMAGYRFEVADKFELEPSALLKGVKGSPLQVDINLKGIYNKMVWLGASYRSLDAVTLMAGAIIKEQFELGYAYDITTSNLNNVSNGSHEILLAYKIFNKK